MWFCRPEEGFRLDEWELELNGIDSDRGFARVSQYGGFWAVAAAMQQSET